MTKRASIEMVQLLLLSLLVAALGAAVGTGGPLEEKALDVQAPQTSVRLVHTP